MKIEAFPVFFFPDGNAGAEVTPKDSDSGSRQRWWCGLSGAAVKATSDPWLTWRTPTITTVSSEKPLCGCAQSLESTSRRTACSISHRANGGANVSKKEWNARGGPQRIAGQRAARPDGYRASLLLQNYLRVTGWDHFLYCFSCKVHSKLCRAISLSNGPWSRIKKLLCKRRFPMKNCSRNELMQCFQFLIST